MMSCEIEMESEEDEELAKVRIALRTDEWSNVSVKFKHMKDELSHYGQLILRGTRIGCVRRKCELKLWLSPTKDIRVWPKWKQDSENACGGLVSTLTLLNLSVDVVPVSWSVVNQGQNEPLTSTELPDGPWQLVSADLIDVEYGYHLLVVIDYFSWWSDVAVLRNSSTTNVIHCMERFFVTHGLPHSMRTNNGPQFISEEFRHFMEEYRTEQAKGIPYWPPSNGEVEHHNETLLKILRIAKIEKADFKREMENFILAYRSTTHSMTGMSPAKMLFNRKLRTKLPNLADLEGWEDDTNIEEKLLRARERDWVQKTKDYADAKQMKRTYTLVIKC